MNWVMVLLVFNVQTGDLQNHVEQVFDSQKACDTAGQSHTVDVKYPDGEKASYICLPDQLFFGPDPDKKKGKGGILHIL